MENMIDTITRPTKELVRAWLLKRRQSRPFLPESEQIKRELGWKLNKPGGKQLRKEDSKTVLNHFDLY